MRKTVLRSMPVDHGYDTVRWTRMILVALLERRFGVRVAESTVGLHLRALDLNPQQPGYRTRERNRAQVAAFLAVKFPKIQRLAERTGADIAFEDEAGVGVRTRAGRTWRARGGNANPPRWKKAWMACNSSPSSSACFGIARAP